jgi:hypothetical protein
MGGRMSGLPELWREHQHAAFPPTALGMSIDGLPLVKLDARLGAHLTASLRSDGLPRPLPPAKLEDLRQALALAARAVAELSLDAPTRLYFERLLALGDTIQRV